ncbi:MAG: prepilin-type N-terminal cleavage/methylation domain-containing protein [Candidatus Saccharimonas sp.]
MKQVRRGFTIIELVVVIVVIGILAVLVVVAYNGAQGRARDTQRRQDISNIAKAMELYYNDNGTYPVTGGSTTMGANWSASNDSSWATFESILKTAGAIDKLPVDPQNYPSTGAGGTSVAHSTLYFSYTIYVNKSTHCGSAIGQMYVILYRLESTDQETYSDGDCSVNEVGSVYGTSFYRSVK